MIGACSFVLLMIYILLSGVMFFTPLDYIVNQKFMCLSAFLSGVIGYSVGGVLDRYAKISD